VERTDRRRRLLRVGLCLAAVFTLLPASVTGINFTNTLSHARQLRNHVLLNGSGVAAGDIDGDGWCDLYFCGLDGPNVLYRNLGNGKFQDITAEAGVSCPNLDATGCAFADLDGDGSLDLIVNSTAGGTYVFFNDGHGHFQLAAQLNQGKGGTSLALGDIDGDGKPEFIMSTGADPDRVIGYAKPDWSDVTKSWTFHPISTKGAWSGHGMGYADLNGDGRIDILQGAGWWEQPAAGPASGLWTFHPVPFGRGDNAFIRGADLLVYDVNGDGLPDVITSYFAHGPGLGWFEQHRSADGAVSFTPHLIMDASSIPMAKRKSWEETDKSVAFTELHALSLVDMDGDGLKDVVTGKRWWSHGIEFEENDLDDPPVMYWFRLVRKPDHSVEFVPHMINNFTGIGTQIFVLDLNGDGTPEVLTAARKGAFIFFNNHKRGRERSRKDP